MATKSEYDDESHYENFEKHVIDCNLLEIGNELCIQFGISSNGHHFVAVFDGSSTVTRWESEESILNKSDIGELVRSLDDNPPGNPPRTPSRKLQFRRIS